MAPIPQFVLSIDAGTTGVTALILSVTEKSQEVLISYTQDFPQEYPRNNWVEHDLDEIWSATGKSISRCLKLAKEKSSFFHETLIKSIGITNQRETLCVFSRKTGAPLRKAIVWQCKRSLDLCEQLKGQGHETLIRGKTGLLLDPYFTGSKLKWVIEEEPEIKEKIFSGEGLVGTVDTFLLYKLTQGESFFTEPSNASRTLLYNIHENKWDNKLLELMGGAPKESLPEVISSDSFFGETKGLSFLPDKISINGILGDQQASLFGHACFLSGEAKCTYGTGAFLLMNTGEKAIPSNKGLLTTISWKLGQKTYYALEGSCFIAGAAISFLRDNLKLIENVQETGLIPLEAKASPDLYFVPSLSGLGAPHWIPEAKGALLGLTRSTTKEEIIKACLEGIAFQVNDLLETFKEESSQNFESLSVDGGASSNQILMKTQAYLSQASIKQPESLESTAYGAALLAAFGKKILTNLEEIKEKKEFKASFQEKVSTDEEKRILEQKKSGWRKALRAVSQF